MLIAVCFIYNTGLDMHIRVQIMSSGVYKVLLFVDHFFSQAYISHEWHFLSFHLVSSIQMLLFSFQSNQIAQVRLSRLYRFELSIFLQFGCLAASLKHFLPEVAHWPCGTSLQDPVQWDHIAASPVGKEKEKSVNNMNDN